MIYYPHHIGDFIRDTSRLSDSQCMAYLRLIWLYYESEEPLTDDVDALAFRIGSDRETVGMLLKCYFYANASRWHHRRIDDEIAAYRKKSESASKSAKARWGNAKSMRTHSDSNANQEPITNNQYKDKNTDVGQSPPSGDVSEVFEFWKQTMASPRSLLDTKRQKLISAAIKTGYTSEQLREAIRGCSLSPFHMGKNDRNTKYNGLDLILRNAEQIDKFIAVAANPESGRRPRTIHDISTMDYSKGVSDDGSF